MEPPLCQHKWFANSFVHSPKTHVSYASTWAMPFCLTLKSLLPGSGLCFKKELFMSEVLIRALHALVQVLRPLAPFACPEAEAAYPPLPAGEQVQRELAAINLKLC